MYKVTKLTARKLSYEKSFGTFEEALKSYVDLAAVTLQAGLNETIYLEAPSNESYNGITLFPHYIETFYVVETADNVYVIFFNRTTKHYELFEGFEKRVWEDNDLLETLKTTLPF